MKFKNTSQRNAVMAQLRKAGFSKLSCNYIYKHVKPVKIVRNDDKIVIVRTKDNVNRIIIKDVRKKVN